MGRWGVSDKGEFPGMAAEGRGGIGRRRGVGNGKLGASEWLLMAIMFKPRLHLLKHCFCFSSCYFFNLDFSVATLGAYFQLCFQILLKASRENLLVLRAGAEKSLFLFE